MTLQNNPYRDTPHKAIEFRIGQSQYYKCPACKKLLLKIPKRCVNCGQKIFKTEWDA